MPSVPSSRASWRPFVLLLAASPLALTDAQAQQSVTLDELSVVGEGGAPGLAAAPRIAPAAAPAVAGPAPAAPTPIAVPVGEVNSTVGRQNVIDNRPAVNIADVVRNSPGVTIRQGNGPRDVIISVRGNNARVSGVLTAPSLQRPNPAL